MTLVVCMLLCVLLQSTTARHLLSTDEVDMHGWALPAHRRHLWGGSNLQHASHDDGDLELMTSVPSHLGTYEYRKYICCYDTVGTACNWLSSRDLAFYHDHLISQSSRPKNVVYIPRAIVALSATVGVSIVAPTGCGDDLLMYTVRRMHATLRPVHTGDYSRPIRRRQSPNSATVAVFSDKLSPKSATSLQYGQAIRRPRGQNDRFSDKYNT